MGMRTKTFFMKNKIIFILLLVLGFTSCQDKHEPSPDCTEDILAAFDMQPYNGEEMGCEMHLMLFERNGGSFYLLNSHCADMVFNPLNCLGEAFCDEVGFEDCTSAFENATFIEIVGIQK